MRFIHWFLVGYVVLMVGGAMALWQLGVLDRTPPIWIEIGVIVAVGAGMMLGVSSGKPVMTTVTKEQG